MKIYDRKRRIDHLESLYKALENEETDLISEFEEEYGQPDNWDEDITLGFNNLHDPLRRAMDNIWTMKEGIRQGFL